jgi:aminoglycoside phosphotransferase (APT) family kinase protein
MPALEEVLGRRPPTQTLQGVVDAAGLGGRVVSVESLGGTWLACHAVDIQGRRGGLHRFVLRRWVRPGWEEDDPEFTAEQEARTLALLAESSVPAPALVAADPNGAVCDAPTILTTRLPGQPPRDPTDMRSFVSQLAAAVPPIHSVNGRAQELVPAFRRYYDIVDVDVPSWARQPRLWERALSIAGSFGPDDGECFIHRDYHQGNTLWRHGELTGIVDWTAASWGAPAIDVGHMRWNLAMEYSVNTADAFLAAHAAVTNGPLESQPYWDVVTFVDVLPEMPSLSSQDIERAEEYLATVVARI